MKEKTLATPDSEKDPQSSNESLDLQEDAHIQLSKGRFLLVLTGLVLAIFLVSISFLSLSLSIQPQPKKGEKNKC